MDPDCSPDSTPQVPRLEPGVYLTLTLPVIPTLCLTLSLTLTLTPQVPRLEPGVYTIVPSTFDKASI